MRDLESLLGVARELGLRVVPTLFAQSVGDCVMLPAYAVDRRRPRAGTRCVTDARVVDGGPRDIYTDPLMLEAQVRWLDALLAGFAGHPAIAAWDLGHDPASTIRPVHIADMAGWAALLGERVRGQDERCRLTLGQADVLRGRGVRLAALAEHVDELGLAVRPQRLPLPGDPLDLAALCSSSSWRMRLPGPGRTLLVDLGIASGQPVTALEGDTDVVDSVTAADDIAARRCDEMLQRLVTTGVAGVHSSAWSDWGDR